MTHLAADFSGGLAQGTIQSLFGSYFDEDSAERKQSADPYALDPPGSRFVLPFSPPCFSTDLACIFNTVFWCTSCVRIPRYIWSVGQASALNYRWHG